MQLNADNFCCKHVISPHIDSTKPGSKLSARRSTGWWHSMNSSSLTPSSVAALKQQAIRHHQQGEIKRAIGGYKYYLSLQANDVNVWCHLGAALRQLQQHQSAVNCYHRALYHDPDNTAVLGHLAGTLCDLYRFDEALALYAKVLSERPNHVQSLMHYASALRDTRQFEQALRQLDKALSLEPNSISITRERARNLLYLGRYQEAWLDSAACWEANPLIERRLPFPQWRGEQLQGKRLLLHCEQRFGDTIMAARCVPLLKQYGAHITLQCKPQLHRLFARLGADVITEDAGASLERQMHIDAVATDGNQLPQHRRSNRWAGIVTEYNLQADHYGGTTLSRGMFDCHCPLMSLLQVLNISVDTIPEPPVLHIPVQSRNKFGDLLHQFDYFNIGIVWSGSVTNSYSTHCAVALERFLPLAELPGVRLHSLQKGPREKDLYACGADSYINNLGTHCIDFADTAAAISYLNLVVSVDGSVAHLAASLGKPVINLLQYVPHWLYTVAETSTPWYPSMRLIKQQQAGQWGSVFDSLDQQVRTLALRHSAASRQQHVADVLPHSDYSNANNSGDITPSDDAPMD